MTRKQLATAPKRYERIERPKILVIDDDEDIQTLISLCLKKENAEIRTAANGKEELEVLQEFLPDVIILDLLMPVMDGISFVEALRENPQHRQRPLIVVTAKRVTPKEEWRVEKEAVAVLTKGLQLEQELRRAVRKILKKKH